MKEEVFWAVAKPVMEEYFYSFLPENSIVERLEYELKVISADVIIVSGTCFSHTAYSYTIVCKWQRDGVEICHAWYSAHPDDILMSEYRRLQDKSRVDEMTQVYSRRYMERMVNRILDKKEGTAAFIMMDLDNFKLINDRLGHVKGDECLIWFAGILKEYFRNTGQVGRIGGDEFCVFINDYLECSQVKLSCRGFLEYLREQNRENGRFDVSCSMGICFYMPGWNRFMDLYDRADRAMYEAKREKKGVAVFKNMETHDD